MVKKVGKCIYVHKSNLKELYSLVKDDTDRVRISFLIAHTAIETYEVVKYDAKRHTVSLIESPDWNTANEPEVGDSYRYDLITWKCHVHPKRKNNPQIYHSKEMFVSSDYDGFDIEIAKDRTEYWSAIPDLDKKRIGNKDYWVKLLKENGMEI